MVKRFAFLPLFLLLGACAQHPPIGSVSGGECRLFERPTYAVRGLRPYDQDAVDQWIESGVGGCGWQRPAPRPPEIDASPAPKSAPAVKPKPAKRGLVKRARDKLWPKTSTAPIVVAPAASDRPVAEDAPSPDPPLPPPPPKPRRPLTAIEELLHLSPKDE